MRYLGLLALLVLTGCASLSTKLMKPDTAKLAEEYTIMSGTMVAPTQLMNGNHRLVMFFTEQPPEPQADKDPVLKDGNGNVATDTQGDVVPAPKVEKAVVKEVLTCVAENDQNKQVLVNVQAYLKDPKAQGKLIYLYGKKLDGRWNEYVSGINFYVEAIGLYIPESGQYVIITTGYGDGAFDNISWESFIKQVGMMAIKGAI